MKQIFLVILFSTMLFSAQKQIILGCYLEDGNGAKAIKRLNKYITNDSILSENKRVNSLNVELKRAGDYDVVTIAPFDTKEHLSITLKQLAKYYNDFYSLPYPLSSKIIEKQFTAKVIAEPKEEPVVEPIIEVEDEIKEEVIVEEELTEDATQLVLEVDEEPIVKELVEIEEPVKVEDEITPIIDAKGELVKHSFTPVVKEEVKEENYYLEYALALLGVVVLLGIGLFIYMRSRKEETLEFDFTE